MNEKTRFYIAYLWLAYNLLDFIFTHWGIERGHVEWNLFGSALIAGPGREWLYIVKLTMTLFITFLIAHIGKRYPSAWTYLRMWNLVLCGVVCWNIMIVI